MKHFVQEAHISFHKRYSKPKAIKQSIVWAKKKLHGFLKHFERNWGNTRNCQVGGWLRIHTLCKSLINTVFDKTLLLSIFLSLIICTDNFNTRDALFYIFLCSKPRQFCFVISIWEQQKHRPLDNYHNYSLTRRHPPGATIANPARLIPDDMTNLPHLRTFCSEMLRQGDVVLKQIKGQIVTN